MTDALRRDVRQAVRASLRNPVFTLIVIITLALGIGATTAIFTVLDRVVLRPLPYPDSSRLLWIDSPAPGFKADAKFGLSMAEFFFLKNTAHTIQDIATYSRGPVTVTGKNGANRLPAAYVSASFFRTLRMHAVAGRLLVPDDDRPHATPAVVLGYGYWQDRFNKDPRVIGSTVTIDMTSYRVVGVLEPATALESSRVDLWIPEVLDEYATPQSTFNLSVIARLAPGATVQTAKRELVQLKRRLPELYPSAYPPALMKATGLATEAIPLHNHIIGDLSKNLWMLLGAVTLVLLVACVNVANLFLVRTEGRRREVAIRAALGASRRDLAWQFVTESLLLSVVAGVGVGTSPST